MRVIEQSLLSLSILNNVTKSMKYKHKKHLNICMHVKQKANSLYISTLCATDI